MSGTTLLELIVSLSLLVIVTAMIIALFIPSMSLFRRQSGKSDAYRGCLMLMEKFRIGLMNTQLETVTVAPTGHTISWQKFEEAQPFSGATGDALMSPDFLILHYQEDEERVYLKEYRSSTAAPSDEPSALTQAELTSAVGANSERSWVLARNIVEFAISDKDDTFDILEPPLSLAITCQYDTKGTATNDFERFSLETNVTPRSARW